jgi:uncharacterized YccA/Bax inhibitor family protein
MTKGDTIFYILWSALMVGMVIGGGYGIYSLTPMGIIGGLFCIVVGGTSFVLAYNAYRESSKENDVSKSKQKPKTDNDPLGIR